MSQSIWVRRGDCTPLFQIGPQGRGKARGQDGDSMGSTGCRDPGQALLQRNLAIAWDLRPMDANEQVVQPVRTEVHRTNPWLVATGFS